ncbi:MAG: hypothetical protein AAGN35_03950 [Bacteroidota bacterium]
MFDIEYFPFSDMLTGSNAEAEAAIGDFTVLSLIAIIIIELIFLIGIASVSWESGDSPRDPRKRQTIFYSSLGLIAVVMLLFIFGMRDLFTKSRHVSDFYTRAAIVGPILLAGFFGLNYLLGKFAFPSTKLGSIFGGRN